MEGEEAPRRPVKTGVPALGRFLCLQRREEREVRQRRQRGQASQSVCSQGGEGSAGQRGARRGGGGGLAVEGKREGVERGVLAGERGDRERVKG